MNGVVSAAVPVCYVVIFGQPDDAQGLGPWLRARRGHPDTTPPAAENRASPSPES